MNFYEKIRQLCDEERTTIAALEKRLGFGNGSISKWDESSPSSHALAKIADYFDISVDFLLGRTKPPALAPTLNIPPELRGVPIAFNGGFGRRAKPPASMPTLIIPPELRGVPIAFSGGADDLTQDDINEVAKFIDYLKSKRKP